MQVTMTVTVEDLGDLLRLWGAHARATSRGVADAVTALLPGELAVSYSTVQRYMNGDFPASGPDPLLLAAITRAMGHTVKELPEEYQALLAEAVQLMTGSTPKPKKGDTAPTPMSRRSHPGSGRRTVQAGKTRTPQ